MKNRKILSIICFSLSFSFIGNSLVPMTSKAISISTYNDRDNQEKESYNSTISSFQSTYQKENTIDKFEISGIQNLAVNKTNQMIYIYKEPDIRSEKVGILPINGVCDIEENMVLLDEKRNYSTLVGLTDGYIPKKRIEIEETKETKDDEEERKIQEEITKEENKIYEIYLKEIESRKDLTSLDKFLLEKSNFTYIKSGKIEGFVLTDTLTTENVKDVLLCENYAKIMKDIEIKGNDINTILEKGTWIQVLSYNDNHTIAHIKEMKTGIERDIDSIYIDNSPYYEFAKEYDNHIYQEANINFKTKEEFQTSIVNFATQFISNKYIWGGNSLTDGCDCSGFTQQIYKNFGITIDRTAAAQSDDGEEITLENIEPGDLLFYGSNGIGHVSMYIGDGKVIHASNSAAYPSGGIKISNIDYRTPCKIIRVIGDSYFSNENEKMEE